jgi:hypothetical protein
VGSSIRFGASFLQGKKLYVLIWTKIRWATFWAIFSPTHLVALVGRQTTIMGEKREL